MSTVRQVRGKFSIKPSGSRFVALAMAMLAGPAAFANPSTAELKTYPRDDGQTFFALSLTPPADVAKDEPCDVVILFDTSASQAGAYRETALAAVEACIAKLRPQDRVQLLAADLEARPITTDFLAANSEELRTAVNALRKETPLGSTDMESALRTAASRFDQTSQGAKAILYVGDGVSTANLLGTESFRDLVESLTAAKVPVSSYAIGPKRDGRLLAALANQTGGNLYVDEPMEWADDAREITEERAQQENSRRGAEIGASMAEWTRATVLWPVAGITELGEVYPKKLPPLRTDRDTVVVGAATGPMEQPVEIRVTSTRSRVSPRHENASFGETGPRDSVELQWTAEPQNAGESHAFLAQVVKTARTDDGVTLPTVGSAGLAEMGRVLEAEVDGLTDLAERAIATGDVQSAQVASQTILARDPGNIKAQTVQRLVEKQRTRAKQVAQPIPPQSTSPPPAGEAEEGDELSLVRPSELPAPADSDADANVAFPAAGSLTDRFAPEGALVDEMEQQRRLFSQMLRREIENAVIDARSTMRDDPETAIQNLKLSLQTVERAPALSPDMRATLVDKLQIALREAQRAAIIKDELDAEREEQLAAAQERRLLEDRLARNREKERQLVDRFDALIDELRFDEALDVAATLEEVDPDGVTPVVALVSAELRRNDYLQQVTRAARWTSYFDTLYQVELSSVPFPDDPPIVYPAAPIWEELSNRRKDRWGSMDLKASGDAEQRIDSALRSPLHTNGLDFADTPLEEVVNLLQEEYGIPIQLDTTALEEIGLDASEPITENLHNITLRSALRIMLKKLQLTYIIQDEVLMITTPESAETALIVKVYPVADLVLPIDAALLGGQGGGLGGQQGGQQGGGQQGGGGFGGGGQGGGGFGGGQQGGGFFSVPEAADKPTKASAKKDLESDASSKSRAAEATKNEKTVSAIKIDESVSPENFWDSYFTQQQADQAAVRETARQLMGRKQFDQVITMIHAALRHGQPQAWMYESLGIAMELDGRSKTEIERAVMSAADFSSTADELMYIAQYLSRLGIDRRAMLLYQQVAKIEPLRSEAYALALRAAERCDDLAGVRWATVGILSQAWPNELAEIELTASRIAKATLERLSSEGRTEDREAFLKQLQEAVVRDCYVRVSWTGDADIDVSVEEPGGTICSVSEPRTTSGGVSLGDEYAADGKSGDESSEIYVCPKGFAGKYRVRIRRVWGEVAAGKVTVDVYTHMRSGEVQHERQQLELTDKDAMVVFDLNHGRRKESLEAVQLAGAIKRQQALSRSVLAQQVGSGSDPSVLPVRPGDFARQAAFLGRGGAVGFQPIIQVLPEGTMMSVIGVVSADRRYVRVAVQPVFSQIGDVQTFTFAGEAAEQDGDGGGNGGGGVLGP